MTESKLLTICCRCKKIRINDNWISKDEFPELYKDMLEGYKNNLTHTYCPPCNDECRLQNGLPPKKY
ncbi:MAG: hypothetical protein KJ949_01155 [Nanoarchaeota archaeon]|nr:hypothetical protein [Nanoarchaeota archaeon]